MSTTRAIWTVNIALLSLILKYAISVIQKTFTDQQKGKIVAVFVKQNGHDKFWTYYLENKKWKNKH